MLALCVFAKLLLPLQRNQLNILYSIFMAQQPTGTLYNALTSGSKVIGTIIADSDIRIDGVVEGELQCKGKVVVGKSGLIKGTIDCQNAEIHGKIDGKIQVSDSLSLRLTSKMDGEVHTKILIVEPGAVFNGTCAMGNDGQKAKD